MLDRKPGVYIIECIENKKTYVGSSKDIRQRSIDHFSTLRRNKHFNTSMQNSWNKYGEASFICKALEYCDLDVKVLISREQYYIDTLKPEFNIRKIADSNLGRKNGPEVIAKMSEVHKSISPETRLRMSVAKIGVSPVIATEAAAKANAGKERSQEVKDKISASKKGKPVKNQAAATKAAADKARGKPRSEETSRKIAETVARKKALGLTAHSPETIAKIRAARQSKP